MGQCAAKQAIHEPEQTITSESASPEEVKLQKQVTAHPDGEAGTQEYRLRFKDASGTEISPWHDIALKTEREGVYNALIEIPKMTRHKMEVSTKEPLNPIAQDLKKGKLRDYHGPIYWNYGMFPQTWEDPGTLHPELNVAGDNDPLDVVEIGSEVLPTGTVAQVKVLGVLAMIDDGELDWKVLAVRVEDPLAEKLNDIADIEEHCPGVVTGIREWLRWYKTPDDKPLNSFGFKEHALDRAHAVEVISETHEAWKRLSDGTTDAGKLWMPSTMPQDTLIGA